MSRSPYFLYILLGWFYLVSKVALFLYDPHCIKALIYGIFATTLTTCTGYLALRERIVGVDGGTWSHLAAVLAPLAGVPLTVVIMVSELGIGEWPGSRVAIFVTWETLHLLQLLLAVVMYRDHKARRLPAGVQE